MLATACRAARRTPAVRAKSTRVALPVRVASGARNLSTAPRWRSPVRAPATTVKPIDAVPCAFPIHVTRRFATAAGGAPVTVKVTQSVLEISS